MFDLNFGSLNLKVAYFMSKNLIFVPKTVKFGQSKRKSVEILRFVPKTIKFYHSKHYKSQNPSFFNSKPQNLTIQGTNSSFFYTKPQKFDHSKYKKPECFILILKPAQQHSIRSLQISHKNTKILT
jgi:hypothetical protein